MDDNFELYIALVTEIARWVPRPADGILSNSTFNECRQLLLRLRIAKAAIKGALVPGEPRWNDDPDRIRKQLSRGLPDNAPTLDEVMLHWIQLCTDWTVAPAKVPTTRQFFRIPEVYSGVFGLLEKAGYIRRASDRMQWTEKVESVMRAGYYWRSETPTEDEIDHEASIAYRTMPPIIRRTLDTRGVSILSVLENHWSDRRWTEQPLASPNKSSFLEKVADRLRARMSRR